MQASMLSNYQFDKYLSVKKNEDGEEQLKLPLEQILLDAGADFEKVGALCEGCWLRPGLTMASMSVCVCVCVCGVGSKWRSRRR
jgi:hypothetical protein